MNFQASPVSWILFIGVLFITLLFGLHPKDLSLSERATISDNGTLLTSKYTIAVSKQFNTTKNLNITQNADFKTTLTLQVKHTPKNVLNRFMVLASIIGENSENQLVLGQWRNSLVVMTGTSYSNGGNKPRLYYNLKRRSPATISVPMEIELNFSPNGTSLSINKSIVASSEDMHLQLPKESFKITLGNAADKTHGWPGETSRFELSTCKLIDKSYINYPHEPCEERTLSIASYDFSSSALISGNLNSRNINKLTFPYFWQAENYTWLTAKIQNSSIDSITSDFIINILGFIPIGICFYLIFSKTALEYFPIFCTLIACCLLSFCIESLQVLLPSRTSSLIDLIANTLGGTIAALFVYCYRRYNNESKKNI